MYMETPREFSLALTALETDELGDHEADVMLQRWSLERTEEELLTGCYAVLTSKCSPPRLGATLQAVRLASATKFGTTTLWERLMTEIGNLNQAQMSNWIAGFYYYRFDPDTYSRFVRLASLAMRKYDRLSIAIMLSTWSGAGDHNVEMVKYIEGLTEENRE
jgi:hypothetical protein